MPACHGTVACARYASSPDGITVTDRVREKKLDSRTKARKIARLVVEKKGTDLLLLDIKKLSSVADYLFICSAESERQVQAIATHVEEGLRKGRERPLSVEGFEAGRWVLMDYNDVVVHIFIEPVRGYYDIEGLWIDAPKVELKDADKKAG